MKICILLAGKGTRLGRYSDSFHKSLLPLGNKAILSYIIEKFGVEGNHFIIAVGHLKEQIVSFVQIVYPNLKVDFVEVENYDGKGSGPGLSLFKCKEHLNEPFIFTAGDTIITSDIPTCKEQNWAGINLVEDIENWCSFETENSLVNKIHYKTKVETNEAFVGVAYVYNYDTFWKGLEMNTELKSAELQVDNGLQELISEGLATRQLAWEDTGNKESYEALLNKYEKNYTFCGKITDITYQYNDLIIKFFKDKSISEQRFLRAKFCKESFAEGVNLVGSFYSYRYVKGELLSKNINYLESTNFLNWIHNNLWSVTNDVDLREECFDFYYNKTITRLNNYINTYDKHIENQKVIINGLECESVMQLLDSLNKEFYSDYIVGAFHGDLHGDNVITTDSGYKLIDWRHSFGSSLYYGDIYYDIAKFLHTLDLSVETMELKKYKVFEISKTSYVLNHKVNYGELEARDALYSFLKHKKINVKRVEIINALIFINMSPLYDKDMAQYLYLFGRYLLQKSIEKNI